MFISTPSVAIDRDDTRLDRRDEGLATVRARGVCNSGGKRRWRGVGVWRGPPQASSTAGMHTRRSRSTAGRRVMRSISRLSATGVVNAALAVAAPLGIAWSRSNQSRHAWRDR